MSSIHHAAAQGFASQADTYARGRPDYPAALDGWLRTQLGLGPGKTVADVGAGTGKFSRLLARTGAHVIAVEPVAAMRAQLVAAVPSAEAREGTAEALPLADASVDAVVCAQAFHWFANPAAVAEFRRVLRPGGKLGLVWNVRDEAVDWVARLTAIMTPHEGDAPRFYKGDWKRVFPAEGFGPLELSSLPYEHVGPPQQVIVDRVMSVSFIASLPPAGQDAVRAQLEAVIATSPELAGRETVAFPYRTEAYCCTRLD
ncbi:SAM-dependent methyltransferase [Cupriavidus sp. USMAA2-4]|uniref:SAM-dependent methyltransferase n=1 Tax=Cupriavidus malaysiensis TaxID=367825 RepID=A0ABM6FDU3_9BURK|nr:MULTISPECIES: class I SAM-dependent methyltransferase [Cupriavidus]AOY94387.1 SAM-dependent methyltransferase [Cupriavidus sp. USMAA2-4]AOZ02698.1 SAM-dependent methyltransferase [Cupriavidus sp. USMAHM13]AOZ09928.1 SAM-dependent methyltransferase [Cupriavidus malaysiensis]